MKNIIFTGAMNVTTSTYNYDYFSARIPREKTSGAEKNHVNYYPFGLKHKGYNDVTNGGNDVAQKFGYNGVELEESLGLDLYEMELRLYDPAIGRWNAIDIIDHYEYSPYQAFDNNPIYWADPSGADAVYNWDGENKGKYTDGGKVVSFEEALASHGLNSDGSQKDQEQEKKTKAKGGAVDGEYLEDNLGVKHEGGFLHPKITKGKLHTNTTLAEELLKSEDKINELLKELGLYDKATMTASTMATLLKSTRKKGIAGILTDLVLKITKKKLSGDKATLIRVAANYLLENKDPSEMRGVYRIYRNSGVMYKPFSQSVTVDYYDARTGKHLGGIKQGSYGIR